MTHNLEVDTKLKFNLVSDYKSTLHRCDTTYKMVTMSAKLYRIVREILTIKKEKCKYL